MSGIWENAAAGWEANADYVDRHLAAATDRLLAAARITAGSAVLELAAGPGGAGLAAAQRVGATGSVLLSDVAPKMTEAAARRAHGLQNVSTAIFDQEAIDAPDASFDAVIIRHGLMFAAQPVQAVSEAGRVLRPGGRYAAMTWGPRERNPWLGAVLDAVGEELGAPFPPPQVPGPFSLDQPALLADTLTAAGLEEVEVQTLDTPMPADSLDAWWERVPQLAGPLAAALTAMQPQMRESIARRALEAGARVARRTATGVAFEGTALIAAGTAPRDPVGSPARDPAVT